MLSLELSCGGNRRKKRLKNLDNPFCSLCHLNNIRYIQHDDYDMHDSDEFVSNNDYREIMSSERSAHSVTRKHSEHILKCRYKKSLTQQQKAIKVKSSSIYSSTAIFMISLIIILLKHVELIEAFNIDIGTRVVFSQPPSTMFGFSVAGHKEGNVGW